MPRPRNNELYERVCNEAIKQMLSAGYSASSYASIADACGTTRAIVQDYFPKKNLMAMMLVEHLYDASLACTASLCASRGIADETLATVAHLYAGAVTYFEFMQQDAGRRMFLQDFLQDRDNTESLMLKIMSRSFEAIDRIDVVEDPAYRDNLLMSMGGFYEVFYYHLKEGRPLDVQLYFSQVTRIWLRATGYPKEKLSEALAMFALTEEELQHASGEMEKLVR